MKLHLCENLRTHPKKSKLSRVNFEKLGLPKPLSSRGFSDISSRKSHNIRPAPTSRKRKLQPKLIVVSAAAEAGSCPPRLPAFADLEVEKLQPSDRQPLLQLGQEAAHLSQEFSWAAVGTTTLPAVAVAGAADQRNRAYILSPATLRKFELPSVENVKFSDLKEISSVSKGNPYI